MRREETCRQGGMTIVEVVVVVVVVVLFMAALVVPASSTASRRSLSMNCMAKAKAIVQATRVYAVNWDGWTHPDPTHYVKDFGYRLNTEIGYFGENPPWYVPKSKALSQSQDYAAKVKDFRCPFDSAPALRVHGIPSSYQLTPLLAGGNLTNIRSNANTRLALAEVGQRHLLPWNPGKKDKAEGVYVYADLHATFGCEGPPLWK